MHEKSSCCMTIDDDYDYTDIVNSQDQFGFKLPSELILNLLQNL